MLITDNSDANIAGQKRKNMADSVYRRISGFLEIRNATESAIVLQRCFFHNIKLRIKFDRHIRFREKSAKYTLTEIHTVNYNMNIIC